MTELDVGIALFFWGTASMAMTSALARETPNMKVIPMVLKSITWPKTFRSVLK